ncbi:MAG TPA: BREX system ATP-binding domain-containing protein [Streptosporangiaceae bacterium]|nr:BREX system ATP-binding domain-containing protein [Streptosporangiaceae bacterium]
MLCPVLVGREAELSVLTAALDKAESGEGGVVFLAGEAGVGKSRLARELSTLAASRGFAVLTGRAAESAVPVPFRPVAEALMRAARGGLTADAPQLADYRPALGSLVPEWKRTGDGSAEISGIIVGEGILRLLTLPGRAGSLLVLEDLQWADPETTAVVEYLADSLADSRVVCLATVRDDEPSAGLDAMRSMVARRAAAVVGVPRLTQQSLRQMAAACLGAAEVPATLDGLLADCDGLPFAVEEMLAAAGAGDQDDQAWLAAGVPDSIAGSVRNRLSALGPAVSNVLGSAAVLGREFDPALLTPVAGTAESVVLDALDQAWQAMLIEPAEPGGWMLRFRHSLTRRVILDDLLPADRADRSGRAAAAVEAAHAGLPGDWCELAAELHQAAGERVRAAELMLDAGRRALSQGALGTAITLLDTASTLAGRAPEAEPMLAVQVDEVLFQALAQAGDYSRLTMTADRLISRLDQAGADRRRQAQAMIMTARARHRADPGVAVAQLTAGRDIAAWLGDTELLGRADAAAARCALEDGDLEKAGELAGRALASSESAGHADWAATVAIESLLVIGRRERVRNVAAARSAFERAIEIGRSQDCPVGLIDALHELGTVEMFEGGTGDQLAEASELAHAAGALSAATAIDLKLGLTWCLGGDLERAQATLRQCEQQAARIKARREQALAICAQAFASAIGADRAATELEAERAEQVLPGNPEIHFTAGGLARVTASLFADDLPRALAECAESVTHATRVPANAPRFAWAFYPLLRAITGDDGVSALDEARATSAAANWNHGFFAYAEAVLAGRAGDRERASKLADEGQALLAKFAPRWNHLARRLVAPCALADDWGEPAAWLREAAAEFGASGHHRLAGACRSILRQAGHPVPRSPRNHAQVPPQLRRLGITNREMDVFRLVAQGLPNGEIARRLFISPKTVETHVASLVSKTGQTSRRELVAHAARTVPAQGSEPR